MPLDFHSLTELDSTSVDSLYKLISNVRNWDDVNGNLLLAALDAKLRMGTYRRPLNDALEGVSRAEWQFLETKSVILAFLAAVYNYLLIRESKPQKQMMTVTFKGSEFPVLGTLKYDE